MYAKRYCNSGYNECISGFDLIYTETGVMCKYIDTGYFKCNNDIASLQYK